MKKDLEEIEQQIRQEDWRAVYVSLLSVDRLTPDIGKLILESSLAPDWLKRVAKDLVPEG